MTLNGETGNTMKRIVLALAAVAALTLGLASPASAFELPSFNLKAFAASIAQAVAEAEAVEAPATDEPDVVIATPTGFTPEQQACWDTLAAQGVWIEVNVDPCDADLGVTDPGTPVE